MPPKKAPGKDTGKGALGETDLSDVATLPVLNDFVFVTLFAFKYRKNQLEMEHQLLGEFDHSAAAGDPETAEQAKRNRVITMADLLDRAKAAAYLTQAEADDLEAVEPTKICQVLARCTNEILTSIQVPLRRQKADQLAEFEAQLEKAESPSEKESMRFSQKEKQKDIELTVWLKDFPKSAADFRELRRSASQHMPEVDVAIHAAFMLEEHQVINYEEEAKPAEAPGQETTAEALQEAEEERLRLEQTEFSREERTAAFTDLLYINKYAHNCPPSSQMRLFVPRRLRFVGPDPPPEEPTPPEPEVPAQEPPKKGAKKEEVAAPVEVPRTEEQKAADKLYAKFLKTMRKEVTQMAYDLSEFRTLTMGPNTIKKVPLWPKTLSAEEIEAVRQREITRMEEEREKAASQLAEQEKAAAAKAPAKGKTPPPAKPESRAKSRDNSSRPGTAMSSVDPVQKAI